MDNETKSMEEVAFTPIKSEFNNGAPPAPLLDFSQITEPQSNWVKMDIMDQGELRSVEILKGDVINFYGTLDDADFLVMEEYFERANNVDPNVLPTLSETIEISKANKVRENVILCNFVKGVNKDNVDYLSKDLRDQLLKAYDIVNGISKTNLAVSRFPSDGESE